MRTFHSFSYFPRCRDNHATKCRNFRLSSREVITVLETLYDKGLFPASQYHPSSGPLDILFESTLLISPRHGHRTSLHHQSHDFVKDIGGGHGRQLGVGVIRGSDFDNVCASKVDAFQPANDGADLTSPDAIVSLRAQEC